MRIREAMLADAPVLADLVVQTWRAAYRGLLPDALLDGLSVTAAEQRWRQRLADPAVTVRVCSIDERAAGFVTYGCSGDVDADAARAGEVQALYVLPQHWGRGCGYALMSAALADLRARGMVEVTLWVLRGNARAIRFYERQGFRADGGCRVITHRSGTPLDEVRYRRALSPAAESSGA